MFDRDSFVTYVGPASGTSYAAGLSNIESLYGADIDAEYQKDGCKALLQKLNELKLKQPEGTAEMGNLRNRISNLKRYIQFKDSGGGERMKIVEQIRDQKQKCKRENQNRKRDHEFPQHVQTVLLRSFIPTLPALFRAITAIT